MRSTTICLATRLAVLVVVCCLCISRLHAQDEELKKAENDLAAIEKVIADPLSGELQFVQARTRLQALLIRVETLLEDVSEEDDSHPGHKVQDRIAKALKAVRARLPKVPAAVARVGFPIPEYPQEKLLGELAGELQKAQSALANHIHRSPDDKGTIRVLLREFILAQEELAWEAGWPFTSGEANDFRAAGNKLTADIYLARRARGVERVNEQLKSDHARYGRGRPSRSFIIHAPEDRADEADIVEALTPSRGVAANVWNKGTQKFDEQERLALLNGR